MPPKKRTRTQIAEELQKSTEQGQTEAKRELAIRMMKGEGMNKNETMAVALLEDCAASDDTEAMLMLAECCAFGYGTLENPKRVKALIIESARKGNNKARSLVNLAMECRNYIVFKCL